MRFPPPPRCAALAALLALGACQTATVSMREDDIPAGRTLVPGGLTAHGASVVALGVAADACGAPEVWGRSTSGWREVATGAPVPVSPCPSLTARLSPDGRVLAVHDFGAGRAIRLRPDCEQPRARGHGDDRGHRRIAVPAARPQRRPVGGWWPAAAGIAQPRLPPPGRR